MPLDVSAGSFAAVAIRGLFWWTVLSPLALLAVAVLCSRRPRLRAALVATVLAPPVVTLLPVAAMHTGTERLLAAAGAALIVMGIVLAAVSPARSRTSPEAVERTATAALLCGVAGGMTGSVALVLALIF